MNKKIENQNYVASEDKVLEGRVSVSNVNITIKVPSDYSTIQQAFDKATELTVSNGAVIEVLLEAGYRPSRGLNVQNGSYSHITLSSEEAVVTVSNNFTGNFISIQNAHAPKFNLLVDMLDLGGRGYEIQSSSIGLISPSKGIRNAGTTGLYVRTSQLQGSFVEITGSNDRQVWITRGASVSLASANLSGCKGGNVAIYVSRASILDASDVDMSNSKATIGALQALRSKVTLLDCKANNVTGDGIRSAGGAEVSLRGAAEIKNCGRHALRCEGASSMSVGTGTDISGAGGNAIYMSGASSLSGVNINARNSTLSAVNVSGGSIANIPGINMTGGQSHGLYCTGGAKVVATGMIAENLSRDGINVSTGGEVVAPESTINNVENGVYAVDSGAIIIPQSQVSNASGYGLYAIGSNVNIRRGSINNSGREAWDIVISGAAYVNAWNCTTTNSTGIGPVLRNTSNVTAFNSFSGRYGIVNV